MLISLLVNLLVSNALTLRSDKSILLSRIVMLNLTIIIAQTSNAIFVNYFEKGIGIFGGLFHVTPVTQSFNLFLFIITFIILTLTSFYPRKVNVAQYSTLSKKLFSVFNYNKSIISNVMGEQFKIIEYSLIIIFVITGAVFLMSASDLVSVFLAIELQSYGLYIICTLYRDSEKSTKGGLTYFLLGGLSSCFILLGSSLLYINSGTTSLDGIYLLSSFSEILFEYDIVMLNLYNWHDQYYIQIALVILSVGFLFKISAAPFHFWSPDVYDAIPTIVTTFVAIIAKISIFIFFLELVYYTGDSLYVFSWSNCLIISSLFSLIIGSVLGLVQFRIKRLLAYSTISHVGFILLALSINSIESIQAYIFYIITYTISNLNALIILVTIGYSFYFYVYNEDKDNDNLKDINNSPIQLVSQIKGYFYINPYLAVSLSATLFSFIGVPPLIGFFAKQMVLSAALANGYVFMALLAILTSVIGAVYYLNVIKEIFFFKPEYKINPSINNLTLEGSITTPSRTLFGAEQDVEDFSNNPMKMEKKEIVLFNIKNIVLSSGLSGVISILTLILILFIYMPNEWFSLANILTLILFKP